MKHGEEAKALLIKEVVLDPMVDTFAPPSHVGNSRERQAAVLQKYIDALAPFDERHIRKAAAIVFTTHTWWTWPLPGQFVIEANKLVET